MDLLIWNFDFCTSKKSFYDIKNKITFISIFRLFYIWYNKFEFISDINKLNSLYPKICNDK